LNTSNNDNSLLKIDLSCTDISCSLDESDFVTPKFSNSLIKNKIEEKLTEY